MAALLRWWGRFRETLPGGIVLALVYAVMLALVMVCFTGNGQFIYELG